MKNMGEEVVHDTLKMKFPKTADEIRILAEVNEAGSTT